MLYLEERNKRVEGDRVEWKDRIEDKLDKVSENVRDNQVHLEGIKVDLSHHIKRTEILESKVELPYALVKAFAYLAGLGTLITIILKLSGVI